VVHPVHDARLGRAGRRRCAPFLGPGARDEMERARQAVRLLRPVHILTVPDRFARAVSLVLVVFALGACGAVDVSAQTLAAEPLASAPPDELNPAITALLGE